MIIFRTSPSWAYFTHHARFFNELCQHGKWFKTTIHNVKKKIYTSEWTEILGIFKATTCWNLLGKTVNKLTSLFALFHPFNWQFVRCVQQIFMHPSFASIGRHRWRFKCPLTFNYNWVHCCRIGRQSHELANYI